MSKVARGVRKIFKRAVKVVKKIAPVALAVGALVFTGGAALGMASMAGGWSAAAGTVASSVGASGVIGGAMTGAITQAGYGALIGGVLGGKEGMKRGAAAGLLTGAVSGGLAARAPTATPGTQAQPIPSPSGSGVTTTPYTGSGSGNIQVTRLPPGVSGAPASILRPAQLPASAQRIGAGGSPAGLMTNNPQGQTWLQRNEDLVGQTVAGLGEGLMTGANAEAYGEAQRDILRERQRLTNENYEGADPGQQFRDVAPGSSGQSPTQRFDRFSSFQYEYDPRQRKIVRVPV